MSNGVDLAWGPKHVRVTGVIGALSLTVILLGVALGWVVWSVGVDHRGLVTAFAEDRKERAGQWQDIQRRQEDLSRQYRKTMDEFAWLLTRTPAELAMLRRRLDEPERFRSMSAEEDRADVR